MALEKEGRIAAVSRSFTALALLAALALAAVGCGSGSSSSSTSTGSASGATTSTGATSGSSATTTQSGNTSSGSGHSGSGGSGKSSQSIAKEEAQAGDHSIQEYGTEASGGQEAAIVAAMRAFLRALADSDYPKVCAWLTGSNREQLEQVLKAQGGDCVSFLKKVLTPAASAEARKALAGQISKVRVKEGNAFVLFRPPGGKVSYFVLKEEGGEWKATGLASGTPLNP